MLKMCDVAKKFALELNAEMLKSVNYAMTAELFLKTKLNTLVLL